MQIDAAKRNRVLRKAVEPHFFGPPIEGAAPVFDELLEVPDIRSAGPRFPRRLVGETRSPEPFVEIGDGLFGNLECERLRLCRHGDLVWLWFEAIDRALASPWHVCLPRLQPLGQYIVQLSGQTAGFP